MLRKLILVGLIAGASGAANAQSVPSATFSQTNVHNYALIAPGTESTEITVIQNGVTNAAVVDQLGDVNVAEVSQRAKRSNDSYVYQDGAINIAAVTQQYNFGGVGGAALVCRATDRHRLLVRVQQRRREHPRADRSGQHVDQQLRQDALRLRILHG